MRQKIKRFSFFSPFNQHFCPTLVKNSDSLPMFGKLLGGGIRGYPPFPHGSSPENALSIICIFYDFFPVFLKNNNNTFLEFLSSFPHKKINGNL